MTRSVVIGGGIAGLATAALLARDGNEVTLFEARHSVGGRAGSWEKDGFRFDTGPSWYLMPQVFDHFFRLFGTTAAAELDLRLLDPGYRVYFEGERESIDIRASREQNVATFERIEPGAGARLDQYLDSAEATYRDAVDRFLYTSFASLKPFADRSLISKAGRLGKLLAQPLDRFVAGRFRDRRLRQILGYPAVFLGSSPSRTPAMYHLMSHMDMTEGVLYPAGGFTTVIDAITRIAESQGVKIVTDARITRIHARETTAPVVTGVSVIIEGRERFVESDDVVAAADLHHVETELVPPPLQSYPERWWQRRTSGPGAVLVMLGVQGELPTLAHHTLFFTRDWKDNFDKIFSKRPQIPDPASFYVCKPSETDDSVAPAGDSNLFILVPVPADPAIGAGGLDGAGSASVEAVADAAIARLAEEAGIPDLAERIRVRRTVGPEDFLRDLNSWKGGALGPAHTLRQSAMLRGSNASKTIEGLVYAGGSTIPGIGLPMCLISAEIALKRLRGDTTTNPLEEPEPRPAVDAR